MAKKELWVHFTPTRMLDNTMYTKTTEPYEINEWDNKTRTYSNVTVTPKLAVPFVDVLKYKDWGKGRSAITIYLESVTTGIVYNMNMVEYVKLLASGQSSLGYKCWWGYKNHGGYHSISAFAKPMDEVFSEEAKLLAVSVLHGDSVAAMALTDKVMEELA